MAAWLRNYLGPPVFEDEEETRLAELLNTVLLSVMFFALLYAILAPLLYDDPIPMWVSVAVVTPLWVVTFVLLRHGRVRLAGVLFLSVLWLVVTFIAIVYGGTWVVASSSYITILFAAGLLFGVRAALGFAGLSILASLALLYVETTNLLSMTLGRATPVALWLGLVTNLVLAGMFLLLALDNIARALERARKNELEMAESNRELEVEIAQRRRVEEALARERDFVASVMEISPAGITAVDREGQVTFANARAEQVLGLTRDEITQRSYNAPEWRITEYDGSPFPDERLPFRSVLATGKPVFDVRHAIEWPDGRRVLLSINAVPLLDESGQVDGMVATVEDVTQRVQAERALRESEQRFRSIIERSPDGIMLTDEKGVIIEWNPGAEQITGLARDEVLGQFLWDVQVQMSSEERRTPDFLERHRSMILSLLEKGQADWASGLRDVEIVRPCGIQRTLQTLVFVIQTALGYRVGAILRDITETKQAEDEIRKLSRAIEQSPSIVVITDTDGRIEYANPKSSQVTGYMLEEIIDETPRILKSGQQEPEFYEKLWSTIVAGKEWRGEFSNRRKDGEIYWELASISPVRDADGRITHYVKVAEDITERKRAEEALRLRTVELEARNEELDAFAHTVAHDLQNPLSVMIGFAETLEGEPSLALEEHLRSYLHSIAQYGRKMSNIIDELLLLAGVRQMDVEFVPLDMVSIVTEARKRLADMIEQHDAELIVPDTWPTALGYGPWVEEVWVNYISNAIRYGGSPPRVELGADLVPVPQTAEGGAQVETVRFWVRDNGLGLGQEEQARLFIPFTQLAQVRVKGHGLGLSIVRRIMEKLGGQVGVQSKGVPGQGCEFSFSLPASHHVDGT